MEGKDLDGVGGSLGWARGWGCAILVFQDYGLGPGGLLVPSGLGGKEQTCLQSGDCRECQIGRTWEVAPV